jgi:hypothetical protein
MPWQALRRPVLRHGRRWRALWRGWRMPAGAEWQRPMLSPIIAGLTPEQQRAAVQDASGRLGATAEGEIHSGAKRTGIGSKLIQPDGSPAWLKITAKGGKTEHWHRRGEQLAQAIDGVPKPAILRELEWNFEGTDLHAFVYSFMPSPSVQPTPWVSAPMPELDDAWIAALAQSLRRVGEQPLTRWTVHPGPVARMVGQRFGRRAPYDVDEWHMAHGDLHWGNVTAPALSLIDWEFYGAAPRGFDAAMLLMFASNDLELYERFETAFADDLNTRSGLIARLYTIAARLRRIEEGKSDPRHYRRLEREAERLLKL